MSERFSTILISISLTFSALQASVAQGSDSKTDSSSNTSSSGTKSTDNSSNSPGTKNQGSDSNPNSNSSKSITSKSNLPNYSSNKDPIEEKYGATAASIKRLDPLMTDAQSTLSNTEYTYFQSKLNGLKESAANDWGVGRQKGWSFVEPLKSLESELSNSIEQAKQSNSENKLKLDNALEHLHATFSDRRDSLSRQDQARFIDMMDDLENRARSVTSSAETANRMATLTEEIANLETTIVGKTLFNNTSARSDQDSRGQKSSSIRVLPDNQKPKNDDPPPIPVPLTPLIDPPKPALPQVVNQIESLIKQLVSRGSLGTLDEEQFRRRLSLQKDLMQEKQPPISFAQQEIIRKELEQLLSELSDRAAGR